MKTIRIAQAAIAASLIATATFADDWNGLSVGVTYGIGDLTTEVPFRDFDLIATGLNVRFLAQGDGPFVAGVEGGWHSYDGEITKSRRLKSETANYGFDVSGLIGVDLPVSRWIGRDVGHFLPHAIGGLSYINTSLHGSEGYHYGFGVIWKPSKGNVSVTLRHTYREFDGPAQGSDLRAPTTGLMVHWTF